MLSGAASLHADIVMLEAGRRRRLTHRASLALRRSWSSWPTVNRQASTMQASTGRWADDCSTRFGRRTRGSLALILARTRPFVWWYLASSAYMQAVEQLDGWHFERAVQLFLAIERPCSLQRAPARTFSGPQIQNVLAPGRRCFRAICSISSGDEGDELGKAERLFRQSLEWIQADRSRRIRLGRVLGRRGRHQDAMVELRASDDGDEESAAAGRRTDVPRCGGGGARILWTSRDAPTNAPRIVVSGCPGRRISRLARSRPARATVPARCRRSNPC